MSDWNPDIIVASITFVLVLLLYIERYGRPAKLPIPPGPKGLPIIGNLNDIPKRSPWESYHEWCKELNTDVLCLNLAGTTYIVLDTSEAVTDLLETRSSIYSGRPRMPMVKELMGWDFNFGFMDYGEKWRRHRRLIHHSFHPAAARQFRPHLLRATRNLLLKILNNPEGDFVRSVRENQPTHDPYVRTAEQGVAGLSIAGVPGAFLVDSFPFLKYVPGWMPGAGFQKKAKDWKKLTMAMLEVPFPATKRNIANGVSPLCFVSVSFANMGESRENLYCEDDIQATAGSMYSAGTQTNMGAISTCILGLLRRPDVLKRAQEELDNVLQPGHLPDFEDETSLPFITAIVKESLRWKVVLPIALPRFLQVDEEYKGYRLPAGSIILPNAWAMLHDEKTYPDPFEFNPDRFMKDGKIDESVRDPAHACWGFGRRICPGRFVAYSSVWITVASLLASFDIKKAVDHDGIIIEPTYEYTSALACLPMPFKCTMTPRSKAAKMSLQANLNQEIF